MATDRPESDTVAFTVDDDGIAWLGLDKQGTGTNVLSSDVMAGLHERLGEIEQAAPKAVVVYSGKKNGFVAGADIKEFPGATMAEVRDFGTRFRFRADGFALAARALERARKGGGPTLIEAVAEREERLEVAQHDAVAVHHQDPTGAALDLQAAKATGAAKFDTRAICASAGISRKSPVPLRSAARTR